MLDGTEMLERAKKWAYEAGRVQMEYLDKNLNIETKSTSIDLITEVDYLSEKIILEGIKGNYPDHSILSEEAGTYDIKSDYMWIVDPLDGTTNYAQGLPVFAVSIALQYRGETVLGVVYAPFLKQMFTAVKGEGSYLNDKRIKVSSKTEFKNAFLATGFPYDRAIHPDNNLKYFCHFKPRVRGIRRLGSAAYDLACVAAGIFDGYWELNLNLWDVAAGAFLVEEAGGKVIYLKEKRGVSLVAGNEVIAERIVEEIKAADLKEQNL
ncbi:myo-inositol-1(or 4)-monophosphatase [Thermosyntropha lipolytica DSM 11003]|uniref:Inositol-1-monophosphatase n=1 Tax=Thermosyntropha lipolytica DSM 11003 TaxID=1123382 RepID=A0A1M5NEM6_9FIRM|nr:inositol monophosphatase family protein [Thermosyntropha lipolytica]SHG87971.1 myo-inositol-1(or 4)-monophosphatase [Thermosyntropha lipolytica DSM 11003]